MWVDKLITHEDPFHIHKFFGLIVLMNFTFQYLYYGLYGTMILNNITLMPHILLHVSSFIFKVLEKRGFHSLNMFIWKELRLHSLVFAYRGCFSILYPEWRVIFGFLTMFLADCITYKFGNSKITSVRGDHSKETNNLFKKTAQIFFSTSQLGATIICFGFFQEGYSNVLAFSTLLPIQTSAFGLTLIRKNIINKTTWQILYTIQLLFVYVLWYYETNNLLIIPLSTFCYLLRSNGASKYYIFYCLGIVNYFYKYENLLEEIISQINTIVPIS